MPASTARLIRRLVPRSGSLTELVSAVAAQRERPIHLLGAPLGTDAPSGMWVATERADYVVYPQAATPTRAAGVICHELAHILLDHEPQPGGQDLLALAAVAAPSLDSSVAARMLARHGYACQQERDAELLGTQLAAALTARESEQAAAADRLLQRLR